MSSSASEPPSSATCWICLDALDENNAGLQRGCACRGDDSGWAHVSCLSTYAQKRSNEAYAATIGTASRNPFEFVKAVKEAWLKCPTCMQPFTGGMRIEMSTAFMKSCKKLPHADPRYLISIASFGHVLKECSSSPEHEDIPIDDPLIKALSLARSGIIEPSSIATVLESEILMHLVEIYMDRGDNALALKFAKEIRDHGIKFNAKKDDLVGIEEVITGLSTGLSGQQSYNSEAINSFVLECLNDSIETNGKDHITTFEKVKEYASVLFASGKHSEACDLLEEYIPRSKRVLGPDHPETRSFQIMLAEFPKSLNDSKSKLYLAKLVGYQNPSLQGRNVFFGPAKGDDGNVVKYVVYLGDTPGGKKSKKFKVPAENLLFARGTPVVLLDLVSAQHLNGMSGKIVGFHQEEGRYKVILESDEDREIMVEKQNVRVDFE